MNIYAMCNITIGIHIKNEMNKYINFRLCKKRYIEEWKDR